MRWLCRAPDPGAGTWWACTEWKFILSLSASFLWNRKAWFWSGSSAPSWGSTPCPSVPFSDKWVHKVSMWLMQSECANNERNTLLMAPNRFLENWPECSLPVQRHSRLIHKQKGDWLADFIGCPKHLPVVLPRKWGNSFWKSHSFELSFQKVPIRIQILYLGE